MALQPKMKALGLTGINVSEFCLGTLPMGPLQGNLPRETCVEIVSKALEIGVNFFDTAEKYQTQPYLGEALGNQRNQTVIATKSDAEDYDGMNASVEKSLQELATDYIDIYHLHAAKPSTEVFSERKGALECLQKRKEEGVIRAVGISTHHAQVVHQAAEREDIDVVYPLINKTGLGIIGGSLEDMESGITKAHRRGKGIYIMKPLGGGALVSTAKECFLWAKNLPGVDSVSVGVVSTTELLQDLKCFGIEHPEVAKQDLEDMEHSGKRLYIIQAGCNGCGSCVEACPNQALSLVEGKAQVDPQQCLLCCYCAPECPEFLIRVC